MRYHAYFEHTHVDNMIPYTFRGREGIWKRSCETIDNFEVPKVYYSTVDADRNHVYSLLPKATTKISNFP